MAHSFKNYVRLKSEYNEIFTKIFETYYEKGYFGNINKEDIQKIQYEWFCKVINTLEANKTENLIPYVANHNNKITREYFSALTGKNVKAAKRSDISEALKGD